MQNSTHSCSARTDSRIVTRARQCGAQRGHAPNFVNVDFSNLGDVTGAIDTLNRVSPSSRAGP